MTNIVIDSGSSTIKAGFSDDDLPRSVFPTVIGISRRCAMIGMENKNIYVGDEVERNKSILALRYPIERGIIKNWDHMENIWKYTFENQLQVSPSEHPVLLTESSTKPTSSEREKTTQIMIETFNTPALYLANQAALSLYESGSLNGIVLDSGDQITHAVPIYQGFTLPHAIIKLEFGGKDLTDYLAKMITEKGITISNKELFRDIKEKFCYVAYDFQTVNSPNESLDKQYDLPDGNTITIGNERFRCAESLFQPSFIPELPAGLQQGIHQTIFNSVEKCDNEFKHELYSNVVLSGGSTMIPGLSERLYKELINLSGVKRIKIHAPVNRIYSSWRGGAMLSSLSSFEKSWVTKEDYDENGPSIVHKKCL